MSNFNVYYYRAVYEIENLNGYFLNGSYFKVILANEDVE